MKIRIVGESDTKEQAKLLKDCFKDLNAQIAIATIERFPLGDAMVSFLFYLSSKNDFAFILISNSNSSLGWIARELKMQQSCLESCLNVYPIFLAASYIPDYWLEADNRYFVFDSNLSVQINRWFISID